MLHEYKQKRLFLSLFSLLTALILGISILFIESYNNRIGIVDRGLHICYKRTTQSFMAIAMKDFSSSFLSTNFRQDSQDCFGDLLRWSEKIAVNHNARNMLMELNTLSAEIFWFHRAINKKMEEQQNQNLFLDNLLVKNFEKIDGFYTNIVSRLEWENKKYNKIIFFFHLFLTLSLVFSLMMLGAELWQKRKQMEDDLIRKMNITTKDSLPYRHDRHAKPVFYFKGSKKEVLKMIQNSQNGS